MPGPVFSSRRQGPAQLLDRADPAFPGGREMTIASGCGGYVSVCWFEAKAIRNQWTGPVSSNLAGKEAV